MSRTVPTLAALLGAFSLTLGASAALAQKTAQATKTGSGSVPRQTLQQGTVTAPSSTSSPQIGSTSTGTQTTATVPGLPGGAGRDIVLSPTQLNQQFLNQRAAEEAAGRTAQQNLPGSALPIQGAGTTASGTVITGQVLSIVPGRSITIQDISGIVRTFPLPASYSVPVDIGNGTYVVVTTVDGGFVNVANASGVLPASAVSGGAGESAPNITQIVAANDSIYRPNLTTQPITVPQNTITGIGGFYTSGAGTGQGYSTAGGTAPFAGTTMETAPAGPYANGTFATASTLANNDFGTSANSAAAGPAATMALAGGSFPVGSAVTGIPSSLPVTSLSYETTPLPTLVARMEGADERRLPAAALHARALASIEGTGSSLVTHAALPTYRVVSWDGGTLVVKDDQGTTRRYRVSERARVPGNLQAGKLVVLDVRGDVVRSVRYLL